MSRLRHFTFYTCATVLLSLFVACQKTTQDNDTSTQVNDQIVDKLTSEDIKGIKYTDYAMSDAAESTTKNWLQFQEMNKQIELLKQADLSFFKDDKAILKSTLDDLKSNIPNKLKETSIEVRLTSLETNIYKLEGVAILQNSKKEALIEAIKDVLISHTNLIFQINRKLEKDAQNIQKPF